jgi:cytochrome c biogenesis protein CcmG, thiol:disulfide interchange protein DsbE
MIMRRLLVLLPLLAFGALAALFLNGLFGNEKSRLPSTLIGQPSPTITLPPLEGLARAGTPVPGFGGTDLRAKDSRLKIIGINQRDQPANALKFLADKGNPYAAVGVDPNARAGIEWGVYGVPETFIVRGDGSVAHKLVGPLTPQNIAAFRAEIEKAMR